MNLTQEQYNKLEKIILYAVQNGYKEGSISKDSRVQLSKAFIDQFVLEKKFFDHDFAKGVFGQNYICSYCEENLVVQTTNPWTLREEYVCSCAMRYENPLAAYIYYLSEIVKEPQFADIINYCINYVDSKTTN